jgi:hypothetical protein
MADDHAAAAVAAAADRRAPLPARDAHYLRHLLRGQFCLVPADGAAPSSPRGRAIAVPRARLGRLPKSPAFSAALAAATGDTLTGRFAAGRDELPELVLDGLGRWQLGLLARGRLLRAVRRVSRPAELVPTRTLERRLGPARRLRHVIPLRWRPHVRVVLDVRAWPSGAVDYDCWLVRAGRPGGIALPWTDTLRLINLFRDMAASAVRAPAAQTRAEAPDAPMDAAPAPLAGS